MSAMQPISVDQERPGPGDNLPTHSPDGVDLTMIRWMLSLTPAERLQALQDFVNSIPAFREAYDDV